MVVISTSTLTDPLFLFLLLVLLLPLQPVSERLCWGCCLVLYNRGVCYS